MMNFRPLKLTLSLFAAALMVTIPAHSASAQTAAATPASEAWPEAWFEIFKLAPGKHEEFVRLLKLHDDVSAAAGLPPVQLFFHNYGAEWDVLLYKPVSLIDTTPEQDAAMAAKAKELKIPTGPEYFIYLRSLTASHTDTKTYGPISADQWLQRLEQGRTEAAAGRE